MEHSQAGTDQQAPHISAQLRGETMAYALQSAIYNIGANFFEPYINYRIQKHYAKDSLKGSAGSYTQNLAGEFAGDIIGASSLMLAEAICPEQLHACSRTFRGWIDPLYSSVAHRVFAAEKNTPDYEQEIEKWKVFQERNFVRSSIIATASLLGNVATQKLLIGNPSPTRYIFAGKLASTTLTTSLGLMTRFAFPSQTKALDNWIGKNVFSPILEDKGTVIPPKEDSHVCKLCSNNGLAARTVS